MVKRKTTIKQIRNPETGELSYPYFDNEGNLLTKEGFICETPEEERAVIRESLDIKEIE